MFRKETVFVLGAGASWHYGYPTGEELVADVLRCTQRLRQYLERRISANYNAIFQPKIVAQIEGSYPENSWDRWRACIAQCDDLINRLQSTAPLVIDYFLGWNRPLEKLGRAMIACALLERESHGAGKHNYNRVLKYNLGPKSAQFRYQDFNDNWVRFVVHQLLLGCADSSQLDQNNVRFVTFNYDRSLERLLKDALNGADFLKRVDIDAFLAPGRIVHMYGALNGVLPDASGFQAMISGGGVSTFGEADSLLDFCVSASENIRVIDPHSKGLGTECAEAQGMLDAAENVYFLGFGFDPNNTFRLGWPSQRQNRNIYFTNMDDAMTVNKRFAAALNKPAFAGDGARIGYGAEKSTRNCYDAIALDFGALDQN
jgi:hypothetical protein